ncbi:hypothetical protein VTL71DRAFT_4766 [Oculimacula yallundae]|uniref:C2H2-type domain-containing protein n=1 Tax=Oculimacula yallundae TaxID=86028 RepID=A0ABR4C3J4_9HELO
MPPKKAVVRKAAVAAAKPVKKVAKKASKKGAAKAAKKQVSVKAAARIAKKKDRRATRNTLARQAAEAGNGTLGIRARRTAAPAAPLRLDTTAQNLRAERKRKASEDNTVVFPPYGTKDNTRQDANFLNNLSPQIDAAEAAREGYYPLSSAVPVNRTGTWDAVVIARTCAVCGFAFQSTADGTYNEHMRHHHPGAPHSHLHGAPRIPHTSLMVEKTLPKPVLEIALKDADSRARFAALPGSERYYVREQVRPANQDEFVADGDNPQPRGGHPFFPWDVLENDDTPTLDSDPPDPEPLPDGLFEMDEDHFDVGFSGTEYAIEIEEHIDALKALQATSPDDVEAEYIAQLEALARVIHFFIDELNLHTTEDDPNRLEYTKRNLRLIMYQAHVGFGPQLRGDRDVDRDIGDNEEIIDSRTWLQRFFDETAPFLDEDGVAYTIPRPPRLDEDEESSSDDSSSHDSGEDANGGNAANGGVAADGNVANANGGNNNVANEEVLDPAPPVDADEFADLMDQLHRYQDAVAAEALVDDDYSNLFVTLAEQIIPFHEQMNFNANHTDAEWELLERRRFAIIHTLRPAYEPFFGVPAGNQSDFVASKVWVELLFALIDPVIPVVDPADLGLPDYEITP